MTSSKPPKKKPSTTRRKTERQGPLDAALESSVKESVRAISKLIEDAKERGAFDRQRAPRRASKPSATSTTSNPGASLERIVAEAKTEDQQLRALEAAAMREIALPADAFVIGEPIEVIGVHYSGHPRVGLTANCRRDGNAYAVGLGDVAFTPGSDGARFVSRYRAWLGLGELPQGTSIQGAARGRRHKASGDDITIGEPALLIVLACKSNALRCRVLGTARELTLRTAVRDEVPGEIVTVVATKQWTHGRHAYLAGNVQARRSDVEALGLTPLTLHDHGEWDPGKEYWGEEGEPIEEWAQPIIARGKRPRFELEQVLPGADPEDFDADPIIEASELHAAGDRGNARELLMGLLAQDLRCLDAHAHLGNFEFDHRPEQAARHYEMGVNIGAFSLGKKFDGVLPWGLIDNRPFLRCMNGLGLCWWRFGQKREAAAVFRRMLWLNPSDNQGARGNLANVEAGRAWEGTA